VQRVNSLYVKETYLINNNKNHSVEYVGSFDSYLTEIFEQNKKYKLEKDIKKKWTLLIYKKKRLL